MYMRVLLNYNRNIIHVEKMLAISSYRNLLAYHQAAKLLVSHDLHPKIIKIENKCNEALVHYLDKEKIDVNPPLPPSQYRRESNQSVKEPLHSHSLRH